jgi:hypothetical protein
MVVVGMVTVTKCSLGGIPCTTTIVFTTFSVPLNHPKMAFTLRFTARLLSVAMLRGYATKANSMKEATKKATEKKPAATRQKVTMATACTPTVKSPKRSPQAKPVAATEVAKVKKTVQAKAASKPAEKRITAYKLFLKEKLPTITGETMIEKFKEVARLWRALPEVEKAKYIAGSQVENSNSISTEKKPKDQSQEAQPSAKRALSGYALFVKEKMSGSKGNFADHIKEAAVEWKAMTAEKQNEYKLKAKAL